MKRKAVFICVAWMLGIVAGENGVGGDRVFWMLSACAALCGVLCCALVMQMMDKKQGCVDVKQEYLDAKQRCVDVKQEYLDAKQGCVDVKHEYLDAKQGCVDVKHEYLDAEQRLRKQKCIMMVRQLFILVTVICVSCFYMLHVKNGIANIKQQYFGERVVIIGMVNDRVVSSEFVDTIELKVLQIDGEAVNRFRIQVRYRKMEWSETQQLQYGDIIMVRGIIEQPDGRRNPGAFNLQAHLLQRNIIGIVQTDRIVTSVEEAFAAQIVSAEQMMPAEQAVSGVQVVSAEQMMSAEWVQLRRRNRSWVKQHSLSVRGRIEDFFERLERETMQKESGSLGVDANINDATERGVDVTINDAAETSVVDFLRGMLLGDRTQISRETRDAFSNAGIGHLLAVSGTHVAYVVLLLFWILRRLRIPREWQLIPMAVVLGMFIFITGGAPSVIRAVVMALAPVIAYVLKREYDGISILACAAMLLLVRNPFVLFGVGFQLSFAATLSILLLRKPMENAIHKGYHLLRKHKSMGKVERKITEAISLTLAVQIGTFPIMITYFHRFGWMGLLTNFLVFFLLPVVTMLGYLMIVFGLIVFEAGAIVFQLLYVPARLILEIGNWMGNLRFAVVGMAGMSAVAMVLYYLVVVRLLLGEKEKGKLRLLYGGMGVMILLLLYNGVMVQKSLEIIILDVGQGSGVLISTPDRKHVLLDFGEHAGAMTSVLRYKGIRHLDLMIGTHAHRDHIGAGAELLRRFRVSCLVIPDVEGFRVYVAEDAVSEDACAMPEDAAAMSGNIAAMPEDVVAMSGNTDTMPVNATTISEEDVVAMSGNTVTMPENATAMSEEDAVMPGNTAAMSRNAGAALETNVATTRWGARGNSATMLMRAAKETGTEIVLCHAMDVIEVGNYLRLTVLNPKAGRWDSKGVDMSSSDINNASLVVQLEYKGFRMLFTGDVEKEAEQEMLYQLYAFYLESDIIKIGHHGSRTSSTDAFLEAVSPQIAVISVGRNNMYRHPAAEVIERLQERQILIYRTDESGAVIFRLGRRRMERTYRFSIETMV